VYLVKTALPIVENYIPEIEEFIDNNNKGREIPVGLKEEGGIPSAFDLSSYINLSMTNSGTLCCPDCKNGIYYLGNQDYFNQIVKAGENVCCVEYLGLDDNQLTTLPESMQNLTKLLDLYLDNNELRFLPEWFGALISLETLWLSGNHLTKLPDSFVELEALQSVLLMENRLTSFPNEMNRLISLEFINVFGNDMSEAQLKALRVLLPNCEISIDDN
jgi:hypothetical protein